MKIIFLLFLFPAVAIALDTRLAVPPYQIPTFQNSPHFKNAVPAILPAVVVESDGLYRAVINCFPERVVWGIEVTAQAGLRDTFDNSNSITSFDTSGLSKHYIGVVASMPLYSASEVNAERRMETQRRGDVAASIKELLAALSKKRRAQRELGLYTSLESRSQSRVNLGIVDSVEQVGYLEKVVTAQSSLDDAVAAIDGARLSLIGQCRDEVVDGINDYILGLIK
jgi:hypothetical protein